MSEATVHTIEHVDPSPVPESNWLWRRIYVFVVTALLCLHVGFTTWLRTNDVQTLRETIRNDQFLIMLFALLYLAGASAEAIGQIIASIRTSRKETVTSAPSPAVITTTPGGSTTVSEGATLTAQEKPPWRR